MTTTITVLDDLPEDPYTPRPGNHSRFETEIKAMKSAPGKWILMGENIPYITFRTWDKGRVQAFRETTDWEFRMWGARTTTDKKQSTKRIERVYARYVGAVES
jgi:hypothetical protein